MKKLFIFLLIINVPNYLFSQAKKFSISFPLFSFALGGPGASLHSEMEEQGFNDFYRYGIFYTQYPIKDRSPRILVRASFRHKNQGSIYLVGGIAQKGSVEGFKSTGTAEDPSFVFWTTTYTTGIHKKIDYSLYQAGAGYEYTAPRSSIKLAAAASAFFYNYSLAGAGSTTESTVIPGLNLNIRIPLGKPVSVAGLEIIADFNLSPAVQMKEISNNHGSFQTRTKTALTHGSIGLAISFRAK